MTDNKRLAGRRIAITGGASGIGEATAELFVAQGAHVCLLDRNETLGNAVAERLGALFQPADIAHEASAFAAVDAAAERLGGLDGIVNSAGIVEIKPLAETDMGVWDRHIAVNLTGTFLVCRAAMPHLLRHPGATIVNIASAQALMPVTKAPAYAASKAGVVALTKAIAIELAPDVRVNVVCPGLIDTPMHDPAIRGSQDAATVPLQNYPLRRWAAPREVADAILYLTSAESSYVTGTTLPVDGGRTLH